MATERYASYESVPQAGYSTADLHAVILPQPELGIDTTIQLGTLSLLSISTHRDKFPVTACNRIGPKGWTAGHRTIAGTLAFNTLDREAFTKITEETRKKWYFADFMQADEYPFFDIVVTCVNEYGDASYSALYGVTILDSGMTYSLDNIILQESYSYMAKSRVPLQPAYGPRVDGITTKSPFSEENPNTGFSNYLTDTTLSRQDYYNRKFSRSKITISSEAPMRGTTRIPD